MVPSIGILYCWSLQQCEYNIHVYIFSTLYLYIINVYNILSKGQIDQSSL